MLQGYQLAELACHTHTFSVHLSQACEGADVAQCVSRHIANGLGDKMRLKLCTELLIGQEGKPNLYSNLPAKSMRALNFRGIAGGIALQGSYCVEQHPGR